MLSSPSSSSSATSPVAVFSASWLKISSHSSECSSSSSSAPLNVSFNATASSTSWLNSLSHSLECSLSFPSFAVSFSATASSASWLKALRHSSECSFSSSSASYFAWAVSNTYSNSSFDPGGYRWPPTFSKWLKTVFWPFWQFTIFSRF
jgi:hypothetical protein